MHGGLLGQVQELSGVDGSDGAGKGPARRAHPKTFTDPRLCAAIVDRLTFHGTIIETGTDSYRLAHARQEMIAGAGPAALPVPPRPDPVHS